MKIAIPAFQTKISPRFDGAQGFILLNIEKNSIIKRQELPMTGWSLSAKQKQLVALEVDTLICGGIDLGSMQYLSANGIQIYSWITGEIEDAVTRFIHKGLESGIILGAKGRRRGQWRFCTRKDHFCNVGQAGFNPAGEEVRMMPKGKGSEASGQGGAGAGKGSGCRKAGQKGRGSGRGKGRGAGPCRNSDTGNSRQGGN